MQLWWLRRPHATAHPHPSCGDFEVEPGAFVARQPLPRKSSRDMCLQRRLVLAESRVAINPVQRLLRRDHQLGGEAAEVRRELGDHLDHRPAHALLVSILARFEPLAVVVALERTEETYRLFREVRTHACLIDPDLEYCVGFRLINTVHSHAVFMTKGKHEKREKREQKNFLSLVHRHAAFRTKVKQEEREQKRFFSRFSRFSCSSR